jgi:hypothetical protein
MIDVNKDLLDARAILEGRTLLQPTVAHLRALQIAHEDAIIQIALKLANLHDTVMEMP